MSQYDRNLGRNFKLLAFQQPVCHSIQDTNGERQGNDDRQRKFIYVKDI